MSSRDRVARHYHVHEPLRGPYSRAPVPLHRPHPAVLQEELDVLHRDLRKLAADNCAIVDDRAALECDLEAGKEELRRLSVLMSGIRSEKEARMREHVEKARRIETELRHMRLLKEEVRALRGELERVTVGKKEMTARLESLTKDISRARTENEQIVVLADELEEVTGELMHARRMVEDEKKANMEIEEQRSSMEKNMVAMAREIDQLRAELASTEVRPWGLQGGGPYRRNRSSPSGPVLPPYRSSPSGPVLPPYRSGPSGPVLPPYRSSPSGPVLPPYRSSPSGPVLPPYSGPYNGLTPGIAERGPMYAEYDRHSQRGR